MKKIVIFFISVVWIVSLSAAPVDLKTAKNVAQNFLQQKAGRATSSLTEVSSQLGYVGIYIFNDEVNHSFVVVAADDCAMPILGYSTQNTFPLTDISPEANYWLRMFESQIKWAKTAKVYSASVKQKWNSLINNTLSTAKYQDEVEALLTTTWNQRPWYNAQCPVDSSLYTFHPTTGCTATGMAQIMKYWNWPEHGYGSYEYSWEGVQPYWTYGTLSADFENTFYQWSNMPNGLNEFSTQDEIDAIAQLMSHVGISIQMSYNLYGEGSSDAPVALLEFTDSMYFDHTYCPENALPTFFGYKTTIRGLARDNYSDTEWDNMLREDISAGRPVLYGGFGIDPNTGASNGGHCFVLDGYDNDGFFHVNWGWGGYCDGYFPTTALDVLNYSFSDKQEALLGIEPNFEGVSVEEVQVHQPSVFAREHQIVVQDDQQLAVSVFDALGHLVYQNTHPQAVTLIDIQTTGLYVVRVGNTTRKVILQ